MATLDELLNGDAAPSDVDEVILVDPVTRTLSIPAEELILGVEGDEKAECKYFKMPKVVGNNVDVTECSLRIVYTNAAGEEDYSKAKDMVHDDNSVVFCWELSRKVTAKQGNVSFSVCVCRSVDGVIKQEWNTTNATGKVLPGHGQLGESTDEGGAKLDVIATMEDMVKHVEQLAEGIEGSALPQPEGPVEVGQCFVAEEVTADGKVSKVGATSAPSGSGGTNEVFVKTEDGEVLPAEIEFDLSDEDTPALVVVAPTTAEVGQTIVVKAVDESGKPTKWEAVDLPSGGASQNRLLAELTITESVSNITFEFPEVANKVLVELDTQECSEFSGYYLYIAFGNGEGIYPQPFSGAKSGSKYYALAEIFAPGVIKMTTWGGDSKYSGYNTYSTLLWDVGEVSSFQILQHGNSPADLNGAVLRAYGG